MTRRTHVIARGPALVVAVVLVAACSTDEVATADESDDDRVVVTTVPDVGVSSTSTTSPAETATPVSTTPATTSLTSPTTTTESCGSSCPLSDEAAAAIDAFFEAYDGDGWDGLLTTLGTSEPTWNFSPTQAQNTELVRYDFIWASALNQTTAPENCVDQYGTIRCDVEIEDDLHRLLAPFDFPASRCTMTFEIVDGKVVPQSFNGFDCFTMYEAAMHVYGDWFEEHHPDLDPIQGRHYRAWNQTDETAGERAAAHLDEWGEVVAAYVADGGDIFDLRPSGH